MKSHSREARWQNRTVSPQGNRREHFQHRAVETLLLGSIQDLETHGEASWWSNPWGEKPRKTDFFFFLTWPKSSLRSRKGLHLEIPGDEQAGVPSSCCTGLI